MLKNKKAIYILIPLNIFIWGFFAYRIYAAYNSTDEPESDGGIMIQKASTPKDSVVYKLKLSYKDPFLKDASHNSPRVLPPVVAQTLLPKQPPVIKSQVSYPVQLPAPEIKYLGLIKNTSSGNMTALVSINGQSRLVKQNDIVDGVIFKVLSRDSLIAKWGNERIVARK